ncbi:MAG: DUF1573 domain-containing protein [Planctomycetota bacterium]
MTSNIRLVAPSFLLLLAACAGEAEPVSSGAPDGEQTAQGPAPSADSSSGTSTPKAPMGDGAPSDPVVAEDVKVVPASGSTPEMLDTGIDLSHLKLNADSGSSDFPARPATVGPEAPAEPVAAGPAGGLALLDGETETQFGEILEGESASKRFRMSSSGENPLVIERVRPSCGCTAAEIELVAADGTRSVYELGQPIPAGSEFELEASINTSNRRGTMQTNVAIYSNDPASPLRLQLRAEVKPVLELEPLNLDFGTLTSGESRDGKFTISTTVLDPFKLELDESRIIEPLVAELTAVDPDAEGRSKTWELSVQLGPNIPEGIRRYPLRLISDVEKGDDGHGHDHAEGDHAADEVVAYRELNCTVQANVTGLVVATPNFISLGLVRPGQVVERSVRVECLDEGFELPSEMGYEITSLTGGEFGFSDQFTISVQPVEGEEGRLADVTVRLEGMPEDFTGSFGGMVQLAVGHPTKESLNVRFSGVSKAGIPATSEGNQ